MSSKKTIWDQFKDPEFAHAYFDEYINTYIATQLKVLRELRELKQEELGILADMAQERICLMENVNYSSWTVNTLRKLAKALGVRLKVSFETFGSGLAEVRSFSVKNLERKSLVEELQEYDTARAEAARSLPEFLENANTKQQPRDTPLVEDIPENLHPLVKPNPNLAQGPQITFQ